MLQLVNHTGFAASLYQAHDPQGIDSLFTVVKATFELGGAAGRLAVDPLPSQPPVDMADRYLAEPGLSSIRAPGDFSLLKPGADVLLYGHAYGFSHSSTFADVGLAVGPVRKLVRAFGERYWDSGGNMSAPAYFERIPIVWERAFGGQDQRAHDGALFAQTANPVGQGFRIPDGIKPLAGLPLPNLEDPYRPITRWRDQPQPCSMGAICSHWTPRRNYAGTYDQQWQRSRAPFLPVDFDPRFFQLAPPDQVVNGYLQGGELVQLYGLVPGGYPADFHLPAAAFTVVYRLDQRTERKPTVLDTVVIDMEHRLLTLVWRAALGLDKDVMKVKEVVVGSASL